MKNIFKVLVAFFAIFALSLPASSAMAAGSDGPTPYTVSIEGIKLPDGQVFSDGDHVNARAADGKTYSIHFEAKYADPNHAEWKNLPFNHADPRNQYYGKNFIPWAALKVNQKAPFCIEWVQLSDFNEHYGEGGQTPVGSGCSNPQDKIEYGDWSKIEVNCDTQVGDVIKRTRQVTTTKYNYDGSVKSVNTVPETEDYIITELDLAGQECRTPITPIAPERTPATGTCVDGVWQSTDFTVTLTDVEGGRWESNGETVSGTVVVTQPTVFNFVVNDEKKNYLEGDNTFEFTPNTVTEVDCELPDTGGENAGLLGGLAVGALALGGLGIFLARRKATV